MLRVAGLLCIVHMYSVCSQLSPPEWRPVRSSHTVVHEVACSRTLHCSILHEICREYTDMYVRIKQRPTEGKSVFDPTTRPLPMRIEWYLPFRARKQVVGLSMLWTVYSNSQSARGAGVIYSTKNQVHTYMGQASRVPCGWVITASY